MDWSYLVVVVALALGTTAQRVIGTGFGLVITPPLVLAIGPIEAVLVINVFSIVACLTMFAQTWRDVNWSGLVMLVLPAIALTVPGILIAQAADIDVLKVAVGIVALIGVSISAGFARTTRTMDGPFFRMGTGALTGLLNASVGLGAPPLGIFAIVARWPIHIFAATMQAFWVALSVVTVLARQLIAPEGVPPWGWWMWLGGIVPIGLGIVVGGRLATRVDERRARSAVIVFTLLSGIAVLVSGIVGLAR